MVWMTTEMNMQIIFPFFFVPECTFGIMTGALEGLGLLISSITLYYFLIS